MGCKFGMGSAICALAAIAAAQQTYEFTDKGDNMKVTGVSEYGHKLVGGAYEFTILGKAIKASWKNENLTVVTSHIEGIAVPAAKGKLELQTAVMSGGVTATILRPSANRLSKEMQTVVVTGRRATYDASASSLNVSGDVKIVSTDPGARRRMTMTGSTASIVVSRQESGAGKDAVASSDVQGPVHFEMDDASVDLARAITRSAHVEGRADRVHYALASDADAEPMRIVALTGHVELTESESAEGRDGRKVEGSGVTRVFNGSVATLHLGPDPEHRAQETVTSAKVEGPVHFSLAGFQLQTVDETDKKPGKKVDKKASKKPAEKEWAPYTITGDSDSLTFHVVDPGERAREAGASSLLKLTGHVEMQSTILNGTLTGIDEAELGLDNDGNVVILHTAGAQGVVKVKLPRTGCRNSVRDTVPGWVAVRNPSPLMGEESNKGPRRAGVRLGWWGWSLCSPFLPGCGATGEAPLQASSERRTHSHRVGRVSVPTVSSRAAVITPEVSWMGVASSPEPPSPCPFPLPQSRGKGARPPVEPNGTGRMGAVA